jgi:KEOPS complex subunit Cgi121
LLKNKLEGKMIKIIGAKGEIKDIDIFLKIVGDFATKNNITIQSFNADLIFGKDHIISAVEHAIRAISQKTNTTNSLEMEILLYASGNRQLKLAIPKMGVKKGIGNIAFVFVGKEKSEIPKKLITDLVKSLNLEANEKVLGGNKDTLINFGISKNEIDTVTKDKYGHIILEKVAMVDILK